MVLKRALAALWAGLAAEAFLLKMAPPSSHSSVSSKRASSIQETDDFSEIRMTVGILADIQYAPIEDGFSYSGNPRYYRHSLEVASTAAQHFQAENVDLVLQLGDIVDGKCQSIAEHGGTPLPSKEEDPFNRDAGEQCVDHVMKALSSYSVGKILHSYGNHCLYCLDRPSLQRKLDIPFVQEPCGELVGYYDHKHDGSRIRFVCLDSYDIALMRRCKNTSRKRQKASEILAANNHNFPELENSPEGLVGLDRRFVAFNGAVDAPQIQWLRKTLQEAREQQEIVILISHQPILPETSSPVCLIWNYEEILDILREFSDVVAASFSGHAHKGGYKRDEDSGIHFRVFEAALENPHPHKTYAIVSIGKQNLDVRGFGNCKSALYPLDHLRQTTPQVLQNA